MIEEDEDEWGEGTGSPCDKVVGVIVSCAAVLFLVTLAYLLTR